MRNNQPFILFTIAFFIIVISPFLLAEGMFMDGSYYAAISHNLADGIGSFWQPQLETTQPFYEHPPLAFGLQALFFHLFGDSIYIDRLYSASTFLATGLIILLIWKTLGKKAFTGWLPLLLWLCFSLVAWAISNNVLENTMSIFVTSSLLFYLLYKKRKQWLWLVLSGVMIWLASLAKGPTGLFPLAMPCIYGLLFKEKIGQTVKEIGLILAGLLVSYLLLFTIVSDAYFFMVHYIKKQIFGSLQHGLTVNSRFYILQKFLTESIPHFILLALLIGYERITKNCTLSQSYKTHSKIFWFLVLAGLCGVVPIMISLKQRGFYMLSAFPFFALAWALLFQGQVQQFIQHISTKVRKILYMASLLLIGSGIGSIILHSGSYSRDEQLLTDIKLLLPHIPDRATISMDGAMLEEWNIYTYFARYKHISLDVNNEREMMLLRDSTHLKNFYHNYVLKCSTKTLLLYEELHVK